MPLIHLTNNSIVFSCKYGSKPSQWTQLSTIKYAVIKCVYCHIVSDIQDSCPKLTDTIALQNHNCFNYIHYTLNVCDHCLVPLLKLFKELFYDSFQGYCSHSSMSENAQANRSKVRRTVNIRSFTAAFADVNSRPLYFFPVFMDHRP